MHITVYIRFLTYTTPLSRYEEGTASTASFSCADFAYIYICIYIYIYKCIYIVSYFFHAPV